MLQLPDSPKELGGRISPILWRSATPPPPKPAVLARWESMALPGSPPPPPWSIWKGLPPPASRKGKWLLRSSGAPADTAFITADLGITSGRTGSMIEEGEGDLWWWYLAPGLWAGEAGLVGSRPGCAASSSTFLLPLVERSSGCWFRPHCSPPFSTIERKY